MKFEIYKDQIYLTENLEEVNEINPKYNFVLFIFICLFFLIGLIKEKKNLKFNKPDLDQYHQLSLIDS